MEGKYELLNKKSIGIYYDEDRQWLMIHWPTAAPFILARSQQFQSASPGYLKSQAQRSQYHVSDDIVLGSKILKEKKWRQLLNNTQILHLSVYKVRAFIKDSKAINEAEVKPVKGREVYSLADHPKWKKRIEEKDWPKPPPVSKRAQEGGTSKEPPSSDDPDKKKPGGGGEGSGGVDDGFSY
jgi:hypothetical protein